MKQLYVVLGINSQRHAKVLGRVRASSYDKAKNFAKEKWGWPDLEIIVTDEVLRIRKESYDKVN